MRAIPWIIGSALLAFGLVAGAALALSGPDPCEKSVSGCEPTTKEDSFGAYCRNHQDTEDCKMFAQCVEAKGESFCEAYHDEVCEKQKGDDKTVAPVKPRPEPVPDREPTVLDSVRLA